MQLHRPHPDRPSDHNMRSTTPSPRFGISVILIVWVLGFFGPFSVRAQEPAEPDALAAESTFADPGASLSVHLLTAEP